MRVRPLFVYSALALVTLIAVPAVSAQNLSHYRDYTLSSTVASVLATSGARESDVKTTRSRPGVLRELEWRTPYEMSGASQPDPVHNIVFSFYNDQLHQIVVTYARDRMQGLTVTDLVASLSRTYGPVAAPLTARGRASAGTPDPRVVARWEDAGSRLTLMRSGYSGEFQIVLVSKSLNDQAIATAKAGALMDAQEAPQRAIDLQKKEAADGQKVRDANKAGFRP